MARGRRLEREGRAGCVRTGLKKHAVMRAARGDRGGAGPDAARLRNRAAFAFGDIAEAKPNLYLTLNVRILSQAEAMGVLGGNGVAGEQHLLFLVAVGGQLLRVQMAPVRQAIEHLLAAHEPAPLPDKMAAFGISGGAAAGLKRLFMTHAPLAERIAALESIGAR